MNRVLPSELKCIPVGVNLLAMAPGQAKIDRLAYRIASKLTPTGSVFISNLRSAHQLRKLPIPGVAAGRQPLTYAIDVFGRAVLAEFALAFKPFDG